MFYHIVSKLLEYPQPALLAAREEMKEELVSENGLPTAERLVLARFLEYLGSKPLTDLQAAYVQTFDLTPEHALYLTHHLFGDDKNRGPALIDLTEFYKEYGLKLATNELPDYLPLVLEFAAQLDEAEARLFLVQWAKVLKQLADNLAQAESPYADLVRVVEGHAQLVRAAA